MRSLPLALPSASDFTFRATAIPFSSQHQPHIPSMSIKPNQFDRFAIQHTLARYCFALDNKDFDLLKEVFTAEVDTVYPFKGTIKGVNNVADAIKKRLIYPFPSHHGLLLLRISRLAPVTTQHALTTQEIYIDISGVRAEATTYFNGIHFGQGKWEGQQVTAWGKYIDTLVLDRGSESRVVGASGNWLIKRREVVFMGRLGEEGVMEGDLPPYSEGKS